MIPRKLLTLAQQITDANAAFFDPAHQFHGCIAGIHEVLRRQGLLEGRWCLDPQEELSPGQSEEIDRVYKCIGTCMMTILCRSIWMNGFTRSLMAVLLLGCVMALGADRPVIEMLLIRNRMFL